MAQIRNFTSTNDSYFVLDGVSYPKVYEAMLDSGYTKDRVKLVGTNRDNSPLVFSTHYSNIRVDGVSFANAQEAISRLNQVVFSKGGGSGGGGTFDGIATEDSATVSFTGNGKTENPLIATSINPVKIYCGTVGQFGTGELNGSLLSPSGEYLPFSSIKLGTGRYQIQNFPFSQERVKNIQITPLGGASDRISNCIVSKTNPSNGLIPSFCNIQIVSKDSEGSGSNYVELNGGLFIMIVVQ